MVFPVMGWQLALARIYNCHCDVQTKVEYDLVEKQTGSDCWPSHFSLTFSFLLDTLASCMLEPKVYNPSGLRERKSWPWSGFVLKGFGSFSFLAFLVFLFLAAESSRWSWIAIEVIMRVISWKKNRVNQAPKTTTWKMAQTPHSSKINMLEVEEVK